MKNIYLVQANAVYGDEVKSTYIPYAIGCLAAFAFSDDEIKNNYSLGKFIYTRLPLNEAVSRIKDPFLVGFSSSIWNNEYNKALAIEIKKQYPSCIIVFGGHQIPPDAERAFIEYTCADILIHGGGEEAFREILLALKNGTGFSEINNISFRTPDGGFINTTRKNPDTPDYPSPYLTGIFNTILNDGYDFSAIIETNRGCPNHCAFCDWGILRSKVRQFDINKVFAELQWLSDNRIEYVYCADANFGLFDRDMIITDKFTELKKTTGYPKKLKVNFTKNRCEFVGEISKKLSESGMGKSQTLSFQSVDSKVLETIGRKNISLPYFRELLTLYENAGIPTYSELILGLPEETYESFSDGICELIENGQHKSINVYPCELLPNSQLGSDYFIEKYKIKTTKLPFRQFHCEEEESEVTEYSYLITSTSSMSKDEWVDSYFFATLIQSFHCLDITREAAIYMRYVNNLPYKKFYKELLGYVFSDKSTYLKKIFTEKKKHLTDVSEAKAALGIYDGRFGKISYEPDENMFLSCIYDSEKLFGEISDFLKNLTDEKTAEMLTDYQKSILNLPKKADFSKTFPVDLATYFSCCLKGKMCFPEEKITEIHFKSPKSVASWDSYARECVWYGRRDEGMHMKASISEYTDIKEIYYE